VGPGTTGRPIAAPFRRSLFFVFGSLRALRGTFVPFVFVFRPVVHGGEMTEAAMESMIEEYGRAVDALEISENEWINLSHDTDVSRKRSALPFLLSSSESGRRLRDSMIVQRRLVEMLREDTRMTFGVLNVLHGMPETASTPIVIELLPAHPDRRIRFMAARVLGERSGEEVEAALRDYLADASLLEQDRPNAEQALRKVLK